MVMMVMVAVVAAIMVMTVVVAMMAFNYTGRLCVIGSKLNEAGLRTLFEV